MPRQRTPVDPPGDTQLGFDMDTYDSGSEGDNGEELEKLEHEVLNAKDIDLTYLTQGFNMIMGFVQACTDAWQLAGCLHSLLVVVHRRKYDLVEGDGVSASNLY